VHRGWTDPRFEDQEIAERYVHGQPTRRFNTDDQSTPLSESPEFLRLRFESWNPRIPRNILLHHCRLYVFRPENLALTIASIVGMAVFAFPFLVSAAPGPGDFAERAWDASLLLSVVVACSVIVAVGEVSRGPTAGSLSRSVALLGAIVAIDASLRLVPSLLGASPIFALIVLVGWVFGPRFGFAMGSVTLLASAALTAGIGPWLAFQMLCAGWIGLAAGWIPRSGSATPPMRLLALYGAFVGFAFGALMNLYSWPLAAPGLESDVGLFWSPGLSIDETLRRYAAYYMATSFVHDLTRAVANVVLILLIGPPVVRLLQRYRSRTSWVAAS
jgi:energy-coupling factor transport system substrate-specific component